MSRLSPFLVIWLLSLGTLLHAQAPNAVTRESTTTGTVDRIERSSRVVTFRGEGNVFQTVYVDPKVMAFDDLKVGDVVTVRSTESVIVQVRPGAKLAVARDTTKEARKAGDEHVVEQVKTTVTIDSIARNDSSSPTGRKTIARSCTLSLTRPSSTASVQGIGSKSR